MIYQGEKSPGIKLFLGVAEFSVYQMFLLKLWIIHVFK